jgi:glucose-1-phosphate cytidylyltransferase
LKVIILAGGFGSRLSELTKSIPKPLIKIAKTPLIVHIINIYSKYGFNDFYISTGYRSKIIEKYFNTSNKKKINYKSLHGDCSVTPIFTGMNTMTGGRVKMLEKYLNNEKFFLTYGDGVADINIKKLLQFHKKKKKIATVTAVRPPARFGEIVLNRDLVTSFKEKPQISKGWINGGFFVLEPIFLKYISNKNSVLEKEPLEKIVKLQQLSAFKHKHFWQCVDTRRDIESLENLYKKNNFTWLKNK